MVTRQGGTGASLQLAVLHLDTMLQAQRLLLYKTFHLENERGHVHFLTFSCYQRLALLSSNTAREWLCRAVNDHAVRHGFAFAVMSYVIMPNHVHLIVKPLVDNYDVGRLLFSIKRSVSRQAEIYSRNALLPEPVWRAVSPPSDKFQFWLRGSGYDRKVYSSEELREKVEYIHMNPVRAGLCQLPIDWRWSSASYCETGVQGPIIVESAQI